VLHKSANVYGENNGGAAASNIVVAIVKKPGEGQRGRRVRRKSSKQNIDTPHCLSKKKVGGK